MAHPGSIPEVDGLWDWNLVTNRVHFSPRWSALLGHADDEIGHRPEEWIDRVHPDERAAVIEAIERVRHGTALELDLPHRLRHTDGTYRWMTCRATATPGPDGRALRLHGAHDDVTVATVTDPLTGLATGLLLTDRLSRAIEQSRRQPGFTFALTLVAIGASPGGAVAAPCGGGDPLIHAAARRLETSVRDTHGDAPGPRADLVARLDDDRFAVLVTALESLTQAKTGADRLLADLCAPLTVAGSQCFLSPSVGVAVSATGYTRAEDVLRDAGIAMQRARMLGGSACELFDTTIVPAERAERQLQRDLRDALQRDELRVHYQPIVSLLTDRIVGAEALVRWQHPSRGLLAPADFIPFAERTGDIVPLGRWVLREACRQLGTWRQTVPEARDLWISVNVSSLQLKHGDLVADVSSALADASIDPGGLVLELTEGLAIDDSQAARTVLMQLRALGVRISLDDFGTGYSSLGYIRRLPVDTVKIDRSFVRSLESDRDTAALVATITTMARQLGLQTVAEGVENETQLSLLRELRCGSVQGYLMAKPLDAAAATELLRSGQTGRTTHLGVGPAAAPAGESAVVPEDVTGERARRRPGMVWLSAFAAIAVALLGGTLASTGTRAASANQRAAVAPAIPARDAGGSQAPAASPAMTAANVNPPAPAPFSPTEGAAKTVAPATAAPTTAAPKRPAAKTAAPKIAADSVATPPPPVLIDVQHEHVFGGCRGRLRVSEAGLTYTPAGASNKDGFALPLSSLTPSLENDTLTIKAPSKTYRFRSAVKGGGASIRAFAAAMARFR